MSITPTDEVIFFRGVETTNQYWVYHIHISKANSTPPHFTISMVSVKHQSIWMLCDIELLTLYGFV